MAFWIVHRLLFVVRSIKLVRTISLFFKEEKKRADLFK